MPSDVLESLYESVREALQKALTRLGYPGVHVPLRPIGLEDQWGLTSNIAFILARKDASALADRLVTLLTDDFENDPRFSEIRADRGYINVLFNPTEVARMILATILTDPDYGRGHPDPVETVMVEYCQPNTHKAFHIGHLRNAVLGNALVNILRFHGHKVLAATYPGDTGAHVFKTLWAYLKFHNGEEPPAKGASRWLGEIYAEGHRAEATAEEDALRALCRMLAGASRTFAVPLVADGIAQFLNLSKNHRDEVATLARIAVAGENSFLEACPAHKYVVTRMLRGFHSALKENTQAILSTGLCSPEDISAISNYFQLDEEIRSFFNRWENRDPEIVSLWEKTRAWSLSDFNRIYDELGIRFDVWFYESQMEDPGREIVRELLAKNIARESDGAVIVPLDELMGGKHENLGTLMILRSDGTPLYSTKDLALAKIKFQQYEITRSIYVVSTQQAQYFRQLFATLKLWGFSQADKCFHLAYEIVTLPEGMMSSRKGNVVLYDDLAEMLRGKALQTVTEKAPHLDEPERLEIAKRVADGALKFTMLYRENARVVVFDPDESLNFEGRSAPYLQYGYARATRILEKSGSSELAPEGRVPPFPSLHPTETKVLKYLQEFPSVVTRAATEFAPHHLAQHLFNLTQAFNDFYHTCPVLQAEPALRFPRLALVEAYRKVMQTGLSLLGITPLERM